MDPAKLLDILGNVNRRKIINFLQTATQLVRFLADWEWGQKP